MVSLDIFRQDPFSSFQLTSAIERLPYEPQGLAQLNIFYDNPIRTTALGVEERDGVLTLIPVSQRGDPIVTERMTERRKVRYFETSRITKGDTIFASEQQNIRAFGQETELMQVQDEDARRLAGPTGLLADVRYTHENMRLGAIQGKLIDADGTTVLNDWFDEFGIAEPAVVFFNLAANVENTLRPLINQLIRSITRSSKGAMVPGSSVGALCGDAFFDAFVNHKDVIRTYVNWNEAREIRDGGAGAAFSAFPFGGVTWINYRGSDDNSSIKVADDKAKFFPLGAPGVFERALSPAETFDFVNTLGQEFYVIPIFDRDRNMWWRQEVYSYPLFICKRPETLRTGDMDAS